MSAGDEITLMQQSISNLEERLNGLQPIIKWLSNKADYKTARYNEIFREVCLTGVACSLYTPLEWIENYRISMIQMYPYAEICIISDILDQIAVQFIYTHFCVQPEEVTQEMAERYNKEMTARSLAVSIPVEPS